jgi:hypothetical protein
VNGQRSTVDIQMPILNLQRAWICNAMEENQQAIKVSGHRLEFPIKPFEIVTLRVQGETNLQLPE